MRMLEIVKDYFFKWNDFRSRTSRADFLWMSIFLTIGGFMVRSLRGFVIGYAATLQDPIVITAISGVVALMRLFLFIATMSLTARRLHDVDRSGWWVFIVLTIIGIIPFLIWQFSRGTKGENRFGKDPLLRVKMN